MNHLPERKLNLQLPGWKVDLLLDTKKRGIILGVSIALLVVLVTAIAALKIYWLKKYYASLKCDVEVLDAEEFNFEATDVVNERDENGCTYTNESDLQDF
jgi:hypothetical protein